MKQNIYDNEEFAKQYDELRIEKHGTNANDLIEIPTFRKMVPDVQNRLIKRIRLKESILKLCQ